MPACDAGADRSLAAWEIISVVTSALIAGWFVRLMTGGGRSFLLIPALLAFAYIIASMRVRGECARSLGFRIDNFPRAARLLLPPMLFGAAFMLLLGWLSGSLDFFRWNGGRSIFGLPTLGLEWGLAQQFVLQCFINRRAQIVFGPGARSVLLVATVFGLLHFPNPALTAATFAGGLVWAWVYQREPNVWALSISHGVMTWLLVSSVPQSLLNGLRVGYKFFGLFI